MAEPNVELRRAAEGDLYDLIELELSLMPDRPEVATEAARRQCDRLERQSKGHVWFVVAEHRGGIVGQLVLRLPGQPDRWGRDDRRDFADVEDVRVLSSYQRRGIATELLSHVEWECMREGIGRIGLAVAPTEGRDLAAWLGPLGYERPGEAYTIDRGGVDDPCDDEGAERVDMIKEI